jgi:hypothetical protein
MRYGSLFLILTVGIGVSGCDAARQALGLGKTAPDEFEVVSHPPLTMPPTYALVPPQPGAPRPQELSAAAAAETTLLSNSSNGALTTDSGNTSPGEQALLSQAGAEKMDPNIRTTVNQEAAAEREASTDLMERLIFWRPTPQPGTVLDPQKEQQRLQQDAALGQPPSAGGPTPTIVRKKKALLEGIFN